MVTLPCGYITSEEIIRKFSLFYQEINHNPSLETEELNLAFMNNHVQLLELTDCFSQKLLE